MLEVQLANRWGHHGTLGPNRVLKLEGPALKLGRKAQHAGEHVREGWCIADRVMTRLHVNGPLTVHFEDQADQSEPSGPYGFVLIVNDYVFTAAGFLAAYSHEHQCWSVLEGSQSWRTLVIEALPEAAAEQALRISSKGTAACKGSDSAPFSA
jgi:hypothetical protein